MERIMSSEDKIRRAEEIYNRRSNLNRTGTTKVNIREKKDIKLLKKLAIQVLVCLAIYSLFYLIKNNNYIFSEDFINKSKEILSYDINFQDIYSTLINSIKNEDEHTNENTEETELDNIQDDGIGGAEEQNEENTNDNISELSQMEQDARSIKESINFINPIEGIITSKFGLRNPTTSTVPKYHTGLDIANVNGTKIRSATDGEVILTSSEGDYRKSFKS